MDTLQGTLEEARRVVGGVAMGDLFGASEPPPGIQDAYPFNACRWRDAYPDTYRAALEEVLAFVYHNDDLPPDMRKGADDAGANNDPLYAECPACDGPLELLGTLGRVEHYRCRNCGLDSNTERGEYA